MTAAEMLELLKTEGVTYDVAGFESFMAGLIAAPTALNEDKSRPAWAELIAPDLSAAACSALSDYYAKVLEAAEPGFTDGPAPADRLDALRDQLRQKGLDGFVFMRTDEFQGEYLPARADRLHWLTGFSGSAGAAVIGLEEAAIFIDGRYTLQVTTQVDTGVFTPRHIMTQPMTAYLGEAFEKGAKLGFDPWLHTKSGAVRLEAAAKDAGITLVPLDENPIDAIWQDQPAPPLAPIRAHALDYAGESSADKRQRLAKGLEEKNAEAAIITMSDSIAWLLNVRGGDVAHCPLPLSFAILQVNATVTWFVDDRKLAPGLRDCLGPEIQIEPFDQFLTALEALGKDGTSVLVDPTSAARKVFDALGAGGATLIEGDDPCLLPKACKNTVELEGTRAAHRRDGAAVTRFLAWLDSEAPKGSVTELSAAAALQDFRCRDDRISDLSFDTISGAGSNGAIVHYRVTEKTDRRLELGTLYLVDSGGQYLDGTTDITRTIAIGQPSEEMKDRFTRVLKGHIGIATARFPKGITGAQIDAFARQPLWSVGLDFDHGTGHGVGSYLNVHEGPQRIAKGSSQALMPGMILSNEPGFYKTGDYGIRIENLVITVEIDTPKARNPGAGNPGAGNPGAKNPGAQETGEKALGEKPLYGFETITFAPIDLNLVLPDLLTEAEKAWLNAYHAEVRDKIEPQLNHADDGPVRDWLAQATRAI